MADNENKVLTQDLSLWALVGSNLLAIVWAIVGNWPLGTIMAIYWAQSVIIGIFWFFKMITLKEFSVKDFKINDQPVKATQGTKIQTAVFFAVHYGFFHFGYATFIFKGMKLDIDLNSVIWMATVFVMYQGFSFFYNTKWQQNKKPNIGKMMFFPYARIIPMHFTILLGGWLSQGKFQGNLVLVLFMLLKTVADVAMHTIERKGFAD